MSTPASAGRQPWLALVLSLFAPGLGHLYSGQIVKGLVLFCAVLLLPPLVVIASWLPPSTVVLVGLLLAVAAVLALDLYAAVDAYRAARRQRHDYQLRDYNRGIVYVLVFLVGLLYLPMAVAAIRANVMEAFVLPSIDMAPSFLRGDHVLVLKQDAQARMPQRGEVVVFRNPSNPEQNWIKRVIALPGDSVAVKGTEVIVNGRALPRERVPLASLAAVRNQVEGEVFVESNGGRRYLIMFKEGGRGFEEKKVSEGSLFVLGDHRDHSSDSRGPDFEFVPLGSVLGRVQYIYYPAESWSRFGPAQGNAVE
jgi:signal peptidase I